MSVTAHWKCQRLSVFLSNSPLYSLFMYRINTQGFWTQRPRHALLSPPTVNLPVFIVSFTFFRLQHSGCFGKKPMSSRESGSPHACLCCVWSMSLCPYFKQQDNNYTLQWIFMAALHDVLWPHGQHTKPQMQHLIYHLFRLLAVKCVCKTVVHLHIQLKWSNIIY